MKLFIKIALFFALGMSASYAHNSTNKYEGAQLLEIELENDPNKINILNQLEYDGLHVWCQNNNHGQILVTKNRLQIMMSTLTKNNIKHKVLIGNMQGIIDRERENNVEQRISARVQYSGNSMTWNRYYNLGSIYQYLDQLAAKYPQIVRVETIGMSVENRPIKLVRIRSGNPNAKKIWIDAGIHAREWISHASSTYLISQFVENRHKYPEIVQGIDYYIVPVLNPDGYVYTHTKDRFWRKNRQHRENNQCVGVDLNRNLGFYWTPIKTHNSSCSDVFPGPKPFSEPETMAVANYLIKIKNNLRAFMTLHSMDNYILLPYAYAKDKYPPNNKTLMKIAKEMSRAIERAGGPHYRPIHTANELSIATGVLQVPLVFGLELRGLTTGLQGYVLPKHLILPTVIDAFEAVRILARNVKHMY